MKSTARLAIIYTSLLLIATAMAPSSTLAQNNTSLKWMTKVPQKVFVNKKIIYTVKVTYRNKTLPIRCTPRSGISLKRAGKITIICRSYGKIKATRKWHVRVIAKPAPIVDKDDGVEMDEPAFNNPDDGDDILTDTVAPQMFMPQNTVLSHDQPSPYPTAIDLVDGSVNVSCSLPHDAIPVGEYRITCEATDRAKNTTQGSYKITRLEAPAQKIDLTLATTLGQATFYPAPNETASIRLNNSATASLQTTNNNYVYETSQYDVQGTVRTGRIKEDILVKTRLGTKIWTWTLDSGDGGSAPALRPDGSVRFGKGLIIEKPLITDLNYRALNITQPTWNLSGNTLSLTVNDSTYPIPYLIDPTTSYPSVSITGGPTDWSFHTPGPKIFPFTYTNGPALAIECVLVKTTIQDGSYIYPTNLCSTMSSSVFTPYLTDGRHTLSIKVTNSFGTSQTRVTFDVDGTIPNLFTIITSTGQTQPAISYSTLPACANVHPHRGETDFGVAFASAPRDSFTGVISVEGRVSGHPTVAGIGTTGWVSPGPFPSGLHQTYTTVRDRAGNARVGQFDFIADNSPPTALTSSTPEVTKTGPNKFRARFILDSADDACLRHYAFTLNSPAIAGMSPPPTSYGSTHTTPPNTPSWIIGAGSGPMAFALDNLPGGRSYQYRIVSVDNVPRTTSTGWIHFTTPWSP